MQPTGQTRLPPGLHVAGPVANDPGLGEINRHFFGRAQQHPGVRFAIWMVGSVVGRLPVCMVGAGIDSVEESTTAGQVVGNLFLHVGEFVPSVFAVPDAGLIGDDDDRHAEPICATDNIDSGDG